MPPSLPAPTVRRRGPDGEFDPHLSPKTDPAELGGWSVPTLCITGDEDFILPSRAMEPHTRPRR